MPTSPVVIWVRFVVAILLGVAGANALSTVVHASSYTYDGPALARVEVDAPSINNGALSHVSPPPVARIVRSWLVRHTSTTPLATRNATNNVDDLKHTPTTHPGEFESVRGSPAKRNRTTGEIWEFDRLHKDHYEVYKNKKDWEKGKRNRSVWEDGRLKECF